MTNENRKIMAERISKMVPTHEMKKLKDPSKSSLKGSFHNHKRKQEHEKQQNKT